MADLVELDVVVKQRGLKESLSTVERLERQLKTAAKAVDQNAISQQRYNKILLAAKREYQALGVSSQKATADVRNFANAQREVAKNVGMATVAIKGNAQAQMAATKGSNQFGVVTQQAGYQVSDFIVQVQSGTNAFVAFGQQASQLVGVLPLIASPLGLTAGAAVALSAGLGIAIPLVTAIGAAFTKSSKAADKAEEKISGLAKTLKDYRQEQRALAQSVTTDQLALIDRIQAIKELQQEYLEVLRTSSGTENAEALSTIKILNELLLKTTGQQKDLQQLINDEYVERVKSMERANMLASIENKFGQDHIKYRNEARRQAEVELEAEIKASGIAGHIADKLRDRLKTEYDIIDAKVEQDKLDQAAEGRQEAIVNSLKSGLQIYAKMVSENKALQDAAEKIKDNHSAQVRDLSRKIALLRLETQFGKDSALYQEAAAAAARDEFKQARISQGIKGNLLKIEMDAYDTLQSQKKELKEINEQEERRKELLKIQLDFYERQANRQMLLNQSPFFINKDALEEAARIYKDGLKEADRAQQEAENSAQKLREELEGPLVSAIGSVSDAFGDFISRGLKDFKGFVNDILRSFKNMLSQMIATAINNRILIGIGMGGAGTVAGTTAAFAGPMGAMLGYTGAGATVGAGLLGGASAIGSGFMGVMSGGGLGSSFANLGGLLSGSVGGLGAVGAAIPAIAAVAAVIGLLSKKTKVLDTGLRATVEGFDVAIDTFQVTQSSRLFGLLKGKKKTTFTAADAEIADPIIGAITEMQQSIKDAAVSLGIGAKAFDDFSYEFQLSLKGLTEDEQLQKINEEIVKMSNSFVSLTGHFEDVNELLAVAQQRYDLETRLLTLQGDTAELLIRQREREIEATHELNQEILLQIHALEDAQTAFDIAVGGMTNGLQQLVDAAEGTVDSAVLGVDEAFALVQRSVEAKKASIVSTFNELMEGIQARIQAAQDTLNISRSILSSLEGASSGSGMTRAAGMSYLRSLRGASRISDEKKLDDALKAIANPSQDLYTSFVDYQRDFQDQANLIRELEDQASQQLTTDEKALIALQDEAAAAEARHAEDLLALEEQLNTAREQVDVLKGIDNSVKSVEEAILILGNSISAAEAARAELEKLKEQADVYEATNNSFSSQFGTGGSYKGFDLAKIEGTNELLSAADMLGIGTTGKTGAEIQQEISNVSGMAVRLDNATRENQFALGGYHSGGLRMVGERGPEIEATGPSRVFSANQARRMMQNPDLVEAVKSMKEEITELRTEQRQLGINNNKYTKRTYDLYRQWDTEGLPAERT